MKRAHKYQLVKSNKRNDVEMCKLDDDDDRALQISTGKVRLTKTGFVALGIRKALALSSAVAFPLAILFDVSRQTVCRAETSVWAMLVMRSAAFHKIISDVLNRISVFLANKDQATVSPSLALTDVDYAVVAAHDLGVPVPHSTDEIALADAPFFLGGAEEFLLEAPEHVLTAFLATFATQEYNDQQGRGQGGDDPLRDADDMDDDEDELGGNDDQEAYRIQVSKWVKGSLEVLKDPLFWYAVHVSYHTKGPVRHFFNILSKYSAWHSSSAFKTPTPANSIPVVELVVRRIWEIDAEFRALCDSYDSWSSDIIRKVSGMRIWGDHGDTLNTNVLKSIALSTALRNYAGFRRRVVELFDRWPWKLFFLIKANPGSPCAVQRGIASELLDCATDLLEMNARKFRSCCQEELEIISVTGITSLAIIASLCTIATDRKNRGEPMLGISVQEMNMKLTLQDGSIIDPVGPPSEVCKLRARYAHKPKPKQNNKDDAIDDEDDTSEDDGNVNTGQSSDMSDGDDSASDEDIVSKQCREKERDAQVMKLLFSDDDNEIDDASSVNDAGSDFDNNDFDQLSQLNVSMAASAANRTAQVSEIGITEAADALQDQCDSAKKTDSTAFMSDADQQQEAILQQILLGQSGHGPGCNGNSHGDCKPHDKSYDPTIGEAERFRFEQSVAEPMANAFVDHWKINVRQICEALTFREQGKDKPRGDNGEMSLVLEVKDETATVKFVQGFHWYVATYVAGTSTDACWRERPERLIG
ncbi:unnamed protein product [Cladocopium goreaui]|uniref:Uncharacterized protein n=1 Tax=Cladocopium goreaui TaxID=2562237 RepID=A0A9P1FKL3_9DINO|nr:unnamed protein product [Cladocopium goreaui]